MYIFKEKNQKKKSKKKKKKSTVAILYQPYLRKTDFCPCKLKDANQLYSNCTSGQRLCFCYTHSTIPLVLVSKISSFYPSVTGPDSTESIMFSTVMQKNGLLNCSLMSYQQLRSYGDRTSFYSLIRQTKEAQNQTWDPWFTRRVT